MRNFRIFFFSKNSKIIFFSKNVVIFKCLLECHNTYRPLQIRYGEAIMHHQKCNYQRYTFLLLDFSGLPFLHQFFLELNFFTQNFFTPSFLLYYTNFLLFYTNFLPKNLFRKFKTGCKKTYFWCKKARVLV